MSCCQLISNRVEPMLVICTSVGAGEAKAEKSLSYDMELITNFMISSIQCFPPVPNISKSPFRKIDESLSLASYK